MIKIRTPKNTPKNNNMYQLHYKSTDANASTHHDRETQRTQGQQHKETRQHHEVQKKQNNEAKPNHRDLLYDYFSY